MFSLARMRRYEPINVRLGILKQTRSLSCTPSRRSTQPRSLLSRHCIPSSIEQQDGETGHDKLVRSGFLRQSLSGIFHILPLGLRVQDKMVKLLDRHMQSVGASRVSLSALSSEELWRQSGRLDKVAAELFHVKDRRDVSLLLAPTHEEEITTLVANGLHSHKDLPIRLYQITSKFRDEYRPRHGLLRSREFLMKDLYTFDVSYKDAGETYRQVSEAYRAFFNDLKLPIIVAEASSGDMGGDLSHEYHLSHEIGSDTVATCETCGYAANDEVAVPRPLALQPAEDLAVPVVQVWRGVTRDRKTLVNAFYPGNKTANQHVNIHAIKSLVPDLNTSLAGAWKATWREAMDEEQQPKVVNIVDSRLASSYESRLEELPSTPDGFSGLKHDFITQSGDGTPLNLLNIASGDGCPRCETGSLQIHRALELAHTFYLGDRYSKPLNARVALPENPKDKIPVQMGCYGIGISRIIGAIAEHTGDDAGLKWPRAIAPYDVLVVPTRKLEDGTLEFLDKLGGAGGFDVALDDRAPSFGRKMKDADTTGYPVIVVLGRGWQEGEGAVEVQCRALSVKSKVTLAEVIPYIRDLLAKL